MLGALVILTLLSCSSVEPNDAPTCFDGIQNGDESAIDCGGSVCGVCKVEATCSDGVLNGNESGIDCGGPDCELCAPTCTDGLLNGDETDIDCGGPDCDVCQCENGVLDGDEEEADCGGSCPEKCPTCDDGIQNGDESRIDCGDVSICGRCSGSICNTDMDCATRCPFIPSSRTGRCE